MHVILTLCGLFLLAWPMHKTGAAELNWDDFNGTVGIQVQNQLGATVCSGVLLSPQVVLTAAHCLVGLKSARVSTAELLDTHALWVKGARAQIHPGYVGNQPGFSVDVGLLFLEQPILGVRYARQGLFEMSLPCERIGYGGRGGKNIRTWLTSFPQKLQGSYLRVQDAYGVLGDSGGPVYQLFPDGLKLIGVHTGREYGYVGSLRDVSFVQLLDATVWSWITSQRP